MFVGPTTSNVDFKSTIVSTTTELTKVDPSSGILMKLSNNVKYIGRRLKIELNEKSQLIEERENRLGLNGDRINRDEEVPKYRRGRKFNTALDERKRKHSLELLRRKKFHEQKKI